jgi:hypothetical protein
MSNQLQRAETFRALHVPGRPVVLFNAWDAGSAKVVAASGAKALATGSWSVAVANGYADGEDMPFDLCLANLKRIVEASDLPVTIDLESGYGADPRAVGESVSRALRAGAIGCNLEDSVPQGGALRAPGIRRRGSGRPGGRPTSSAFRPSSTPARTSSSRPRRTRTTSAWSNWPSSAPGSTPMRAGTASSSRGLPTKG